jgi:hypothetical protein
MKNIVFGVLFAIFATGCGTRATSRLDGLGSTSRGKNVAIIFGAPNNLEGVPTDVREMSKLIVDPQYNFHFAVTAKNEASVNDITSMSAAAAKDADTLVWFFSGHGGDGILEAQDDPNGSDSVFEFHQVADAIKAARGGKPLKRLVVLLDSCDSGSFVNGSSPIVDESARQAKQAAWAEKTVYRWMNAAYDKNLYEQAFVMASSLKDETSSDMGAEQGGAFTFSLRTSLAALKVSRATATFKDLAEATIAKTKEVGGHTPVYRAFPAKDVENETLFSYKD